MSDIPKDENFIRYLKSEYDCQIIKLRALGINHPETGYTFEQAINTVIYLAGHYKNELTAANKRIEELENVLKECVRCCPVFTDNAAKCDVSLSEYVNAFEQAKQALTPLRSPVK